jgi:hypothetical protein
VEVTVPVAVGDAGETAARIGEGSGRSAYAGAMLLHPFLETVGAGEVFGALESGAGRRYDTTAVALESVFAFALGCSSLEGSKHLQRVDAGLLVGVERFPHLRTLRARLGALADSVDPLSVQVAFSRRCSMPTASHPACSSSMSASSPTPARDRSIRAGTRGGVTPSRADTTP